MNLWVCTTELVSVPGSAQGAPVLHPEAQARRHFFALSKWQMWDGTLNCVLNPREGGGYDIVFAAGTGVVIIRGGLEFIENVMVGQPKLAHDSKSQAASHWGDVGGLSWRVVSGSMHRRLGVEPPEKYK